MKIVAVVAIGAVTAGCGLFSKDKDAGNNASAVGDLTQKLKDSQSLTFTAEYLTANGTTATVVQQPPNSAYIGKDARFIVTADTLYMCSQANNAWTCQKTPNSDGQAAINNPAFTGVAANGFVSAPFAVTVLLAASVSPGAKVDKSGKTIAGQRSTCLKVGGVKGAGAGPNNPDMQEFTACVTDSGLLASFEGALTDGKKTSVTMTKYSGTADASAFQPPPGAKINNVEVIEPPQ